MENQLVPITTASLSFTDRNTGPANIRFTITRALGHHDGFVEHMERPTQAVNSFTQDDVNNNRIIYRPPELEFGYKEREVFFYFTGTFVNIMYNQLNNYFQGMKSHHGVLYIT